jgi:multiple sugar transport system permease protein
MRFSIFQASPGIPSNAGLQDFQSQRTLVWNQLTAAATVFTIPIIVAFFFAQKTFIQGIQLTGSKE